MDAAAENTDATHIADIAVNEFNTPLISDAFSQVKQRHPENIRVYVNADIMLTPELVEATEYLRSILDRPWVMVGRRIDCDLKEPFVFEDDWATKLKMVATDTGHLHGPAGMDYFACSHDLPFDLPDMAVGRPGWDSWFIFEALRRGVMVIDASDFILALHQNHPTAYSSSGVEAKRNVQMAGGLFNVASIRQANYKLNADLRLVPYTIGSLFFSAPARFMLGIFRLVRS